MAQRRILFLCTGNYFRSRFAEGLFNHLAQARGLDWSAFSRGLSVEMAPERPHLSPFTRNALMRRGIPLRLCGERKVAASPADWAAAERVIALKELEHRPLMRMKFPQFESQTEFWHVDDVDFSPASESLKLIERLVEGLVTTLEVQQNAARDSSSSSI
ncbi:MAG: low molecular weight phosphatase family protein [Opitutales bacterium]